MTRFSSFDQRRYRVVGARQGYGLWAPTYEQTIKPDMDRRLPERIAGVDWAAIHRAADLGCGTGRTGAWLAERGVRAIDGVDLTPEMIEQARARAAYAELRLADVCATGLPTAGYDLITACLIDEHLADLGPLYAEAARLARADAAYVLVGYHPFFIMRAGMPTHFDSPAGEPLAIDTHVHLLSHHVHAAHAAGWRLTEMHEQVVDEHWIAIKASWAAYREYPISFAFVWRRR